MGCILDVQYIGQIHADDELIVATTVDMDELNSGYNRSDE